LDPVSNDLSFTHLIKRFFMKDGSISGTEKNNPPDWGGL
jgi:hypothetical protein